MYFPNPFKFKGMQAKSSTSLRPGPRPNLAFWAFLLACLLWMSPWRRRVVAENARRAGLVRVGFGGLRWLLLYHALRDLLGLFSASYPKQMVVAKRSAGHLADMRRGKCLFLTAHVHHFEAFAAFLAAEGVPLRAVARPMSRAWAQRWLVRLRELIGNPVIWSARPQKRPRGAREAGQTPESTRAQLSDKTAEPLRKISAPAIWLREALRHVQTGGCLALLWDQRPPGNAGVTGAFFGEAVICDPLPGWLMGHLGPDLAIYAGYLQPDGKVRLLCLHTPDGSREIEARKTELEGRVLARYHRWLEAVTRRHPGYAYWMLHRRFGATIITPGITCEEQS